MNAFLEHSMAFYQQNWPMILSVAGIIILWIFWRKLWKHLRQQQVSIFQSEFGHVAASLSAVREVIRGTCDYISPNSRPKIRLCVKKNNVRVRIRLQAIAGENVQQLSQKIQHLTALNLQEQFGFESMGNIDVIITGFRGKGGSWQRPNASQRQEKSEPAENETSTQS